MASDAGATAAMSGHARASEHVQSAAGEVVCPITSELPVDPVLAEDLRIYERSAMEKWIRKAEESGGELKSPWTNEPMGPKLLPSLQVRAIIENLVESGMVQEDLSISWRRGMERFEREQQKEKRKKEVMKKANEGIDTNAMFLLGCWYKCGQFGLKEDIDKAKEWWRKGAKLRHRRCMEIMAQERDPEQIFWVGYGYRWGRFGFPENKTLALKWWTKGAKLECPTCVVHLGLSSIIPDGVAKEASTGLFLISQGAAMGSSTGMFLLGSINFFGNFGMPKNRRMAMYWLKRFVTGNYSVEDATDVQLKKTKAKQMLWTLRISSHEQDLERNWMACHHIPVVNFNDFSFLEDLSSGSDIEEDDEEADTNGSDDEYSGMDNSDEYSGMEEEVEDSNSTDG